MGRLVVRKQQENANKKANIGIGWNTTLKGVISFFFNVFFSNFSKYLIFVVVHKY